MSSSAPPIGCFCVIRQEVTTRRQEVTTRWQEVTTRGRGVGPDLMSTGVTRIIRRSLLLAPLPSNTGALPL